VDYLFRGEQPTDLLEQDAAAFNIIIGDALSRPADYELWAEHVPAVDLFIRCGTQWRIAGEGVMGLDYGVLLQLGSLYQVPDMPRVLEDVQTMELHARDKINARLRKT
jgi:hypothetical protein